MENKIEDYLPFYLGRKVEYGYPDKRKIGRLIGKVEPFGWQVDQLKVLLPHLNVDAKFIKPILRPLPSISHDEAEHFAWLCMDSRHHLDEESRLDKNDIDIELAVNDGGNLLDGDVEVYIGLTSRCFVGAVVIRKDGSICVEDEDGQKNFLIDDIAYKVLYLLKQGFDLFGLIPSGLAIDSTTLNPKDNG